MKKCYLFLMILLTSSLVKAQKKNSLELGLNLGFNNSYLQIGQNSYNTTDVLYALNFGLSSEYYFSHNWGLKVKTIYDQKGWANGSIDINGTQYDGIDYKLNYLTIPIMANWHFGYYNQYYLSFGFYEGILLNATAANIDVKNQFNLEDKGVAFDFGFKLPIARHSAFFVEFEGQSSFLDVYKYHIGDDYLMQRASLNIGVNF